jgi:endonuclease/exonuclease/phosphatase family metal-dependent hydrolase
MSHAFTVAILNIHAGVDGWGRPFSVTDAVRMADADVAVLAENWKSAGEQSLAEAAGTALGYEVFEEELAFGRRAKPHPDADRRWMKPLGALRGHGHSLYLGGEDRLPSSLLRSRRYLEADEGAWGIAVLSRLPMLSTSIIDLGVPPRDRTRRAALVVKVGVADRAAFVAGTHMTHITSGSPWQFTRLNRRLSELTGGEPAVFAGDMNMWGPPTKLLMRGWRHTKAGPTWPSWRPHSQIDHVLVRGEIEVEEGHVLPPFGSDHRALRVRLLLPS